MANQKKNNNKKTAAKKTIATRPQISRNTGRSTTDSRYSRSGGTRNVENEAPKKTASKAPNKGGSRGKDILSLVILAVAVLSVVAVFFNTPALTWLRTGLYFLFGDLMYVAPILVAVLIFLLMYRQKSVAFYRRLLAAVLFFFALSGIFAFAMPEHELAKNLSGNPDHTAGGLLGRLNYWMFHSWLGNAGAYIVNGLLMAIAIALFIDFSVFGFMREKLSGNEEKKDLRAARKERRQLEKEAEEIENRKNTSEEIAREKERAEAYRKYLNEKHEEEEEARRQADRFSTHYYGIGNTTIVDDEPEEDTVFQQPEGTIFLAGKPKEKPVSSEELPFDETDEPVKNEQDELPKIRFGDTYFRKPAPEEKESDDGLNEDDEYEKIIITKSGKAIPVSKEPASGRHAEVYHLDRPETPVRQEKTEPVRRPEPAKKPEEQPEKKTEARQLTMDDIPDTRAKEYEFPPLRLLKRSSSTGSAKSDLQRELSANAAKLVDAFRAYDVSVTVTNIASGPTVSRYEVQPDYGVKVSKVVSLKDEIQMALAAKEIRIEAPIPGKSAIGIEVPNKNKTGIVLRDLIESEAFQNAKSKLAFGLGVDVDGNIILSDLTKMPHLLVAGTTGSGKSVCLNTMIMSVIYHAKPTEVKMILIDPKQVEFVAYNGLPHLMLPVVTDPKKAAMALRWAVAEMEKRYEKFSKFGCRNVDGYNEFIEMDGTVDDHGVPLKKMPLILIIVDEFADLMMVAKNEVEDSVVRLAQKARAAGIHLVLATQTPRKDILTGLIKGNIPSRIALATANSIESRIILDMNGAESLVGYGDLLYLPMGANKPQRVQGAYVSEQEVSDVVRFLQKAGPVQGGGINTSVDLTAPANAGPGGSSSSGGGNSRDELFETVGRYVIEKQKASIGQLQRAFSIGFNRAARIVDQLAAAGVVGEEEGTKPRRVLMTAGEFDRYLEEEG